MKDFDRDARSQAVSILARVDAPGDNESEAAGDMPAASAEVRSARDRGGQDSVGSTTDEERSRALSMQADESAGPDARRAVLQMADLKRLAAAGLLRQSFSQGRSKAVIVARVKRRVIGRSEEPQLPAPGGAQCGGGERAEPALSEPLVTSPAHGAPIAAAPNVPTTGDFGPARGRAGSKTTRLASTIPPPVASRGLLTENAVATRLSLSSKTLRNWRVKGLGPPFVRLSRRAVRYEAEVVDEWIATRARRSTSDKGRENG